MDLLGRLSRRDVAPGSQSPPRAPGLRGATIVASAPRDRRPARRLSTSEAEEMVSLYRDGETIVALAARFGVDRSTVMRQLRKAGVPKYAGWTDQVTDDARALYEAGHSLADISQLIGWPPTTIGRHLKASGVKMRPRGWRQLLIDTETVLPRQLPYTTDEANREKHPI